MGCYKNIIDSLRLCGNGDDPVDECGQVDCVCHYGERDSMCRQKVMFDAADAIEELLAKLKANENSGRLLAAAFERLKEKVPKWISVEERLPEQSGRTIVYLQEPNGIKHVSFAQFQKNLVRWDLNGVRRWWRVTHWMPLPAPPKEDAECKN